MYVPSYELAKLVSFVIPNNLHYKGISSCLSASGYMRNIITLLRQLANSSNHKRNPNKPLTFVVSMDGVGLFFLLVTCSAIFFLVNNQKEPSVFLVIFGKGESYFKRISFLLKASKIGAFFLIVDLWY